MTDTLDQPAPPPPAPAPPAPGAEPVASDPADPGERRRGPLPGLLLLAGLVAVGVLAGPWALVVIGAILFSVFLHELGHFLAAKQAGMKVTEYFLGFGPRIFSFRRGETEYGVKAIPAGAYVRIVGMSGLEDVDQADEGRTYREKGYWKRLRVVLAGPAMNFLIAFVLILMVFVFYGEQRPDRWTVNTVSSDSAAADAGLQTGDRIVSISGEPAGDFKNMGDIVRRRAGEPVDIVVERGGQTITLLTTLGWSLDQSAADQLSPLMTRDRIQTVNGQPVTSYAQVSELLASAPAGTVTVDFDRDGHVYRTDVAVPVTLPTDGARGFLGVSQKVPLVHIGALAAVGAAASDFKDLAGASMQGFGRLFSPTGLKNYATTVFSTGPSGSGSEQRQEAAQQQAGIVPVEVGEPPAVSDSTPANQDRFVSVVGIVGIGSQLGKQGLIAILLLVAMVNFFLGLINLVPLPPFDGGHAAIATYEAIRGAISRRPYRADMAKLMPIAYAVFGLLVFVGLSSLYLDVVDPIKINP
jgi:RIP metalloprotease RseP